MAFTTYTSRLRRKAIVRPSGDHANQRTLAAPRVSRRSPLPSAFTTKRSEGPGPGDPDPDYLITRSEVGLLFDDDCLRFELGWRRDNTRVRPSGPSEGVYIRLNLATFGGTGYGQGDGR